MYRQHRIHYTTCCPVYTPPASVQCTVLARMYCTGQYKLYDWYTQYTAYRPVYTVLASTYDIRQYTLCGQHTLYWPTHTILATTHCTSQITLMANIHSTSQYKTYCPLHIIPASIHVMASEHCIGQHTAYQPSFLALISAQCFVPYKPYLLRVATKL